MKTSFDLSKYWANKFVTLSCPICLAFGLKWYFVLLILIYNKVRLSLADIVQVVRDLPLPPNV